MSGRRVPVASEVVPRYARAGAGASSSLPQATPRRTAETMAVYPRTGSSDVPAQPHFPSLERDVLEHWEASDTFQESVRQRPADREFVFYDGPPFANGLPHYGHLITGYVKDVVPRFRTMQGYRVE